MIEVTLKTEDGRLVTRGMIPPFQTMPDVLIWGTRIFKRVDDSEYRECFAVAVVSTLPDKQSETTSDFATGDKGNGVRRAAGKRVRASAGYAQG